MFSSPSNPKPGEVTPPGSSSEESEQNPLDSAGQDNSRESENGAVSNGHFDPQRPRTPHQSFCFKFSLEWIDRPQWLGKNKRLFPPAIPIPAQLVLQSQRARAAAATSNSPPVPDPENGEDKPQSGDVDAATPSNGIPIAPTPHASTTGETIGTPTQVSPPALDNKRLAASKYAGRALAEWAMVVSECDNFFERRRDDGVPSDRMVEIPSLGVENFRNG